MPEANAMLAFLFVVVLVALVSGAADWTERVLARPRIRPTMILRMYRLARADRGICESYYLARTFERATRPKGNQ
jgi:hypothetical protein